MGYIWLDIEENWAGVVVSVGELLILFSSIVLLLLSWGRWGGSLVVVVDGLVLGI